MASLSQLNQRLLKAAETGDLSDVRSALAQGADINTQHKKTGACSVLLAAWNGHTKVLEHLIDQGAPLETPDSNGSTALHKAASVDHGTTAMLIAAGATVDALDHARKTPLFYAQSQPNSAQSLLKAGANPNHCMGQNVSILNAVLGPMPRSDGATPAQEQTFFAPRIAVLLLLLENGANVNKMDGERRLPLTQALSCHLPWTLIEPLIDAGADLNAVNNRNIGQAVSSREWMRGEGLDNIVHPSVRVGMEQRELKAFAESLVVANTLSSCHRPRL